LDSLDVVELILEIDEEAGLNIEGSEPEKTTSPLDYIDFLVRHLPE
jgi:acyl carrier protein